MIKEHIQHKHWYRDSRIAIVRKYGERADLFCDLLAATSPRKSVRSNFRLAHRILEQVITCGDYDTTGMMKNHRMNVDRVLNGQELVGNKVRRFAQNLKGDLEPVTIDVWMLRYLKEERRSLTDLQYAELEAKCQRNARNHGLEPAEYQAVAWIAERRKWGYGPVSFASVMEVDQLQFNFMEF